MHESMIAGNLLEIMLAESAKQGGRAMGAKISCGAFDAVNDEVLCFAFSAIAKGTACEGVELEIEHKPILGQCRECGGVFSFDFDRPNCPDCGGDFSLLPDEPLLLESMEFDTE